MPSFRTRFAAIALIFSLFLLTWSFAIPRSIEAGSPPQIIYSGNTVSEYYFDPTGFFCAFGVTVEATDVDGADDYTLQVGILLDLDSAAPDRVDTLDFSFQPLVINGTPVLLVPAPCSNTGGATTCKVETAFPAPATHRWIEYRSTQRIPATPGSSTLDFVIEAHWPNETTKTVRTTDSAVWVSDDRDDVHGYLVTDYHDEGPFPYMIPECMGKDGPDVHVLFVNGSRGPFVDVSPIAPLDLAIVKPVAGGNGKFLAHLNASVPDPFTVTNLGSGLGKACFPFVLPPNGDAAPVSIWNNIGKESRFGVSNYFGLLQPAPPRAPTFLVATPSGDMSNLPSGSEWTLQAIIVNPAASSPRGASVTNVIELAIQ